MSLSSFKFSKVAKPQNLTHATETQILTKRDGKQLNIFERKVYRRILGLVYDDEKENWRILNNKDVSTMVKKTHYNRDNKDKQIMLVWACTENGRKQNSQQSSMYKFGNKESERQTKKQMAR